VGRRTVRYDVSVDPGRGEWSEVPVQTGAAAPSADGGAGTARRV
jgi:hypothetical protein